MSSEVIPRDKVRYRNIAIASSSTGVGGSREHGFFRWRVGVHVRVANNTLHCLIQVLAVALFLSFNSMLMWLWCGC
jgi:hypothetical protein